MFEVGVVTHFEAAHSLRGDFGPATQLHGHTYRVEVTVKGSSLRKGGALIDLGLLEQLVREVTEALHYRYLDEIAAFENTNTTAEVVAKYFFDRIAPRLRDEEIQSLSVRVWESPHAFASYVADL